MLESTYLLVCSGGDLSVWLEEQRLATTNPEQ